MKEIILIAMLGAVSHPVAGIINAEKWALAEMNERFENANRDGVRIEDELRMCHKWILPETEYAGNSE